MGYGGARAFEALGQGLMGLGSSIYGQRRQKEEDERLKAERERKVGIEDAEMQAKLIAQGGGVGEAPTRAKVLGGPAPTPVDLLPPLKDPTQRSVVPTKPAGIGIRPGGTAGIGISAPPPPDRISAPAITNPVTVQEDDPRFRAIGPKGFGYVKTPEAQDTEEELKQADVSMGLGKAIHGIHPDVSEEEGMSAAFGALRAGGGIPAGLLTPREFAPPAPVRGIKSVGPDGKVTIVDPTQIGPTDLTERVPPTPGETTPAQARAERIRQAKALLEARNKIESMNVNGVPIEVEERARRITDALTNSGFKSYDEARTIAREEGVGMPMDRPTPAAPPTPPPPARPTGQQAGPGAPAPTSTGQTSAPTTVLDVAREQYKGMPDAESMMREDGWSDADIEYMTGGNGGPG